MGHKMALKSLARYIIIGFSEIAALRPILYMDGNTEAIFSVCVEADTRVRMCACVCLQKDDLHTFKILQ